MKAPKNSCQVNFSSVILTSQKAQVSVEASIINTDCLKVRFRNKTKMKIINIFFLQSLILFVKFEIWKLFLRSRKITKWFKASGLFAQGILRKYSTTISSFFVKFWYSLFFTQTEWYWWLIRHISVQMSLLS